MIDHATRAVEIADITADLDDSGTAQVARNPTAVGVRPMATSYQAPNMNATAARFERSTRRGCIDRLILLGTPHVERAIRELVAHDHAECPQQGIGNELMAGMSAPGTRDAIARERVAGLLRYGERAA
ncbi:MAG: hypothetical protein IPM29_03080 [Planctomycetes bacterium]|nr:hypothetical protein [Planctomycetota bacterium]